MKKIDLSDLESNASDKQGVRSTILEQKVSKEMQKRTMLAGDGWNLDNGDASRSNEPQQKRTMLAADGFDADSGKPS